MNKRVFTLLAAFVWIAFSAFAAVDPSIPLKVGSNEGLYQIKSEAMGTFVALDANGKLGLISPTSPVISTIVRSLWCIHVDAPDQGQSPKFDFTNRRFGSLLDIDMDGVLATVPGGTASAQLTVGGTISGWAFSATYAEGVETRRPLFSYYKADSVVALKVVSNKIVGVKLGANEVYDVTGRDNAYLFSLEKPKKILLDTDALNTMLGTNPEGTSFKLKFGQTAASNVFANELKAVSDTLGAYVTLVNKSTGKYLRVDSAYHNTTGVKFVTLTDTTSTQSYRSAVMSPATANGMKTENYVFCFYYYPTSDSLSIHVQGAVLEQKTGKPWSASPLITTTDKLKIYIQDLGDSKVLTVGSNTSEIALGFVCGGGVATTKTTVPSDLYLIKSPDDKYLAVPIYGDTTIQWVTLEKNVDPWTMPSFQWVVEKNRPNSETSPIRITNREFSTKTVADIQLDKETPYDLTDHKGIRKGLLPDSFEAATAAVKGDSLLGYKYADPEELLVTRYKFRYLHEFSDAYYAGVNAEVNDSVLYVGAKSAFSLNVKDPLYAYGYTSEAVAGLKPLYRQSYTLQIPGAKLINGATADNVVLDKEGRFAVSEQVKPLTFLMKTNNEKAINDKDELFYAFLKLDADTTKVGTDDNNLWLKNQIMTESRTSAFSVEVDESPLYRRFNTEKESSVANDDPDTLKFFRVNNPADMLFEDAHSVYSEGKEINFLGVNNKIQFPDAKRAIYVDTAYVNRGTGYIKPQYLLGVGVRIIPGSDAVPCPLDHNHGFDKDGNALDKWTCSHATPGTTGYVRARYLINTVDSAKVAGNYRGDNRDKDYIWNNQVRLAFVEAIHKADTLYILRGDTADWADPVDFAKLPNKIRLDNNLHKNTVFSFRLLEEGSDNFLMESAATQGAPFIAPMTGGWVKIQNGVPVVSYAAFQDAANESEIFNVEKTSESPTANEGLSAGEITIQTLAGAVVVKNAAGKSVKMTNILGQPLADTVLTSDKATVGVPAGIVVVSVEGEEPVKVVVK